MRPLYLNQIWIIRVVPEDPPYPLLRVLPGYVGAVGMNWSVQYFWFSRVGLRKPLKTVLSRSFSEVRNHICLERFFRLPTFPCNQSCDWCKRGVSISRPTKIIIVWANQS